MSLNKTTKRLCIIAVIALVAFFFATPAAWAAEEAAEAAKSGGRDSMVLAVIFITAGFGVVLGAVFPAMAQGKAVKAACEGMARNPGIAGQLMTTMLLGLAMIEALAIYPFVVALILLFIFAGKFI